jgi:hypothetical protein
MIHAPIGHAVEYGGRFRCSAATHPGAVRAHNEDTYVDRPDLGLWAVADGAGGHQAGDVASQIVTDALNAVASGPGRGAGPAAEVDAAARGEGGHHGTWISNDIGRARLRFHHPSGLGTLADDPAGAKNPEEIGRSTPIGRSARRTQPRGFSRRR